MKRLLICLIVALLAHAAVLQLPIKRNLKSIKPAAPLPVTIDLNLLATPAQKPPAAKTPPKAKLHRLFGVPDLPQPIKPIKSPPRVFQPQLLPTIPSNKLPEKPLPIRPPEPIAAPNVSTNLDQPEPLPEITPPMFSKPFSARPVSKPDREINSAKPQTQSADISQADKSVSAVTPFEKPAINRTEIPRYLDTPRPDYPPMARRLRYQGTVVLDLEISAEGKVLQVRIIHSSGYAMLDESAQKAVLNWLFKPARDAGQNVASHVHVPIEFKLK